MSFGNKVLIFDFDGVIADTYQLHKEFLSGFMSNTRIELSLDKSCNQFHASRKFLFRRQLEKVFYHFLTRFVRVYQKPLLYPKVIDAIKANPNRKFMLSLGSRAYMKAIIDREFQDLFAGLYGRFQIKADKGYGASMLMDKFGIDRKNIVFITDTVADVINMRVHEHIEIFAVDWGYCSREKLSQVLDQDHILSVDQFILAMNE